jgi:hypothetical protein
MSNLLESGLVKPVELATTALGSLDYSKAIEYTEAFFWWHRDDYVGLAPLEPSSTRTLRLRTPA